MRRQVHFLTLRSSRRRRRQEEGEGEEEEEEEEKKEEESERVVRVAVERVQGMEEEEEEEEEEEAEEEAMDAGMRLLRSNLAEIHVCALRAIKGSDDPGAGGGAGQQEKDVEGGGEEEEEEVPDWRRLFIAGQEMEVPPLFTGEGVQLRVRVLTETARWDMLALPRAGAARRIRWLPYRLHVEIAKHAPSAEQERSTMAEMDTPSPMRSGRGRRADKRRGGGRGRANTAGARKKLRTRA